MAEFGANEQVSESQDTSVNESVNETSGSNDDESAETINTDVNENQEDNTSQADDESGEEQQQDGEDSENLGNHMIPKKRFDQVNNRMKNAEKQLQDLTRKISEKEYLFKLEAEIVKDPEKEQAIIDILNGKGLKDKTNKTERVDPATELRKEFESFKQKQQTNTLKAYNDEFESIAKDIQTPKQKIWTKLMVQMELDNNHQGWRDRHTPGLVDKVYKDVQTEMNKIFNGQKREYIQSKSSDTSPDIGKGIKGTKVERVPIEDEEAFGSWIAREMKGA